MHRVFVVSSPIMLMGIMYCSSCMYMYMYMCMHVLHMYGMCSCLIKGVI